jgi:hypothetical protein
MNRSCDHSSEHPIASGAADRRERQQEHVEQPLRQVVRRPPAAERRITMTGALFLKTIMPTRAGRSSSARAFALPRRDWSRHVGGSPGERLAAGVFPLVLHMAMAGPAVGADMLYALSRGGAGLHLGINMINIILVMLVVPGAALLLGVLPFARRSARLDAQ